MKKILFSVIAALFIFCLVFTCAASGVIDVKDGEISFPEDAELLKIYFFDTYAWDSILIVCGGKTMLVDCGDTGCGSEIVAPRLKELGIERIDYAVNTHPHDDHINGFISLFGRVEVGAFYTCFPLDFCPEQTACVEAARACGIEVVQIDDSYDLSFGGVDISLFQDERYITAPERCNPASLIMHLSFMNSTAMLTADSENVNHQKMYDEMGALVQSDIVKMPHHGHNIPSYSVFRAMEVKYAVITNAYSARINDSLIFLQNNACPVMYTMNGYVEAVTDGSLWQIKQHLKWKTAPGKTPEAAM